MTSKNHHELRMLAAVTILTGTLVIGLEQLSNKTVANTVRLAQTSSLSSQRPPGTDTGMDLRDTGRMDMRSNSMQGPSSGQIGTAPLPSGMPREAMEFDSRRDNSRMDRRQEATMLPTGPSNQPADYATRSR
jgi:hypothetical protein